MSSRDDRVTRLEKNGNGEKEITEQIAGVSISEIPITSISVYGRLSSMASLSRDGILSWNEGIVTADAAREEKKKKNTMSVDYERLFDSKIAVELKFTSLARAKVTCWERDF